MTTVGDLVDRVFREYLRRPDDQPITSTLTAAITDTSSTATVTDVFTVEEQELLGSGSAVEIDLELATVESYDEGSATISFLKRGALGTVAAAHDAGAEMVVAPAVTRKAVFDNVADAISNLYPRLYLVETFRVNPGRGTVYLPVSARPREILRAEAWVHGQWTRIEARLAEHPERPGWAVEFPAGAPFGRAYVRVTLEPTRPTSLDDTLASIGVDESWGKLIVVDAAASLLHTGDVDATTTEWLTQAIEETARPLGSIENLAVAIERYRERLIRQHREKLDVIDRPRIVHVNPVF